MSLSVSGSGVGFKNGGGVGGSLLPKIIYQIKMTI
jgi:hypothetical protein